eukprot:7352207-Prymnesium_polylepis.1
MYRLHKLAESALFLTHPAGCSPAPQTSESRRAPARKGGSESSAVLRRAVGVLRLLSLQHPGAPLADQADALDARVDGERLLAPRLAQRKLLQLGNDPLGRVVKVMTGRRAGQVEAIERDRAARVHGKQQAGESRRDREPLVPPAVASELGALRSRGVRLQRLGHLGGVEAQQESRARKVVLQRSDREAPVELQILVEVDGVVIPVQLQRELGPRSIAGRRRLRTLVPDPRSAHHSHRRLGAHLDGGGSGPVRPGAPRKGKRAEQWCELAERQHLALVPSGGRKVEPEDHVVRIDVRPAGTLFQRGRVPDDGARLPAQTGQQVTSFDRHRPEVGHKAPSLAARQRTQLFAYPVRLRLKQRAHCRQQRRQHPRAARHG